MTKLEEDQAADQPAKGQAPLFVNSMSVERVEIETLIFPKRSLRKGRKERIAKHVTFQEEYGTPLPAIVDLERNIISGEEAVEAARQRGRTHVNVLRCEAITPEVRRKLRLFEARLTQEGPLDWQNIQGEFLDILSEEPDFNFEIIGFSAAEIDITFSLESTEGEDTEDPADAMHVQPGDTAVSRSGDVWICNGHRVICGDACKAATYEDLMAGATAKAVITDPPYGVAINGHVSGLGKTKHREFVMGSEGVSRKDLKKLLKRALKRFCAHSQTGALFYLFMDWRSIELLLSICRKLGLTLLNICVWKKTNAGMGSFYRSQHELVVVVRHGDTSHQNNVQLGRFGRSRSNVWEFPGVNTFGKGRMEQISSHPTPKPVNLIAEIIKDCTSRGDVVVDGFLGSGTALIAAQLTGRKAYGVELDPLYVDVAVRRFQERFGLEMVHEATGLTFEEMESERQAEAPSSGSLSPELTDNPHHVRKRVRRHASGRVRTRQSSAKTNAKAGA